MHYIKKIVIIIFILSGCINSSKLEENSREIEYKKELLPKEKKSNKKENNDDKKEKNFFPIVNYTGKFYKDERFFNINNKMQNIQKNILDNMAEKLALNYTYRNSIFIKYKDFEKTFFDDKNRNYRILTILKKGKRKFEINLSTEELLTNKKPFLIIKKAVSEAILLKKLGDQIIPDWLLYGLIYYAVDSDEFLMQNSILKIADTPFNLDGIFLKLEGKEKNISALKGYLSLVYIKERYGETILKKFIIGILSDKNDWEESLNKNLNTLFREFEAKSILFGKAYIKNKYWASVISYRKALRRYLNKEYLEAISYFKRMLIQSPNTFLAGNISFWLAMCYYKNSRYDIAAEYFEEVLKKYHSTYYGISKYRHALCFYHQNKMIRATRELYEFITDKPSHYFRGSAYFFLADALIKQGDRNYVFHWLDRFIEEYPKHPRILDALTMGGELAKKNGWWNLSKKYYNNILKNSNSDKNFKTNARENINNIELVEQNPPSKEQKTYLDNMENKFLKSNVEAKKVLLKFYENIGLISFPWLDRILEIDKNLPLKTVIEIVEKIGSNKGIYLLFKILKKEPSLFKEVILGLINININPSFLVKMVEGELADTPELTKKEIYNYLDFVLWGTNDKLREDFPQILKKLNGNRSENIKMMETLALKAGKSQIDVLKKIILNKKDKIVQNKAFNYLVLWKKENLTEFYKKLVSSENNYVKINSIKILFDKGIFLEKPLVEIMKKGNEDYILELLKKMSKFSKKIPIKILVSSLENQSIKVRKKSLSLFPKSLIGKSIEILSEEFLKDGKPLYFYNSVVELFEILTNKAIKNYPNMDLESRKSIVNDVKQE